MVTKIAKMKNAKGILCFPVNAAVRFGGGGVYRGLLQAVQQVMMLALERRVRGLPHQSLSCLLGGL